MIRTRRAQHPLRAPVRRRRRFAAPRRLRTTDLAGRGPAARGRTFIEVSGLEGVVDRIAGESGFSGVVRVDRRGDVALAKAYGWANPDHSRLG